MSETFQPGDRVQIQDSDRDALVNYPYVTVLYAATKREAYGTDDDEPGYMVRYDNGSEVWRHEYDVLSLRAGERREVDLMAALRESFDEARRRRESRTARTSAPGDGS